MNLNRDKMNMKKIGNVYFFTILLITKNINDTNEFDS